MPGRGGRPPAHPKTDELPVSQRCRKGVIKKVMAAIESGKINSAADFNSISLKQSLSSLISQVETQWKPNTRLGREVLDALTKLQARLSD
jgi:hypothetical protein